MRSSSPGGLIADAEDDARKYKTCPGDRIGPRKSTACSEKPRAATACACRVDRTVGHSEPVAAAEMRLQVSIGAAKPAGGWCATAAMSNGVVAQRADNIINVFEYTAPMKFMVADRASFSGDRGAFSRFCFDCSKISSKSFALSTAFLLSG